SCTRRRSRSRPAPAPRTIARPTARRSSARRARARPPHIPHSTGAGASTCAPWAACDRGAYCMASRRRTRPLEPEDEPAQWSYHCDEVSVGGTEGVTPPAGDVTRAPASEGPFQAELELPRRPDDRRDAAGVGDQARRVEDGGRGQAVVRAIG